jgi:hypothetical protein
MAGRLEKIQLSKDQMIIGWSWDTEIRQHWTVSVSLCKSKFSLWMNQINNPSAVPQNAHTHLSGFLRAQGDLGPLTSKSLGVLDAPTDAWALPQTAFLQFHAEQVWKSIEESYRFGKSPKPSTQCWLLYKCIQWCRRTLWPGLQGGLLWSSVPSTGQLPSVKIWYPPDM